MWVMHEPPTYSAQGGVVLSLLTSRVPFSITRGTIALILTESRHGDGGGWHRNNSRPRGTPFGFWVWRMPRKLRDQPPTRQRQRGISPEMAVRISKVFRCRFRTTNPISSPRLE